MTRIDKSDAQLDAEAAAREHGLRWLIVDLRRALWYETPDRVNSPRTSQSPDDELDAKGWLSDPDEGGIGLPFSSRMHRYLRTNHPSRKGTWDTGPDPKSRPAMASIQNESERCHARHTSHQRPGFTRSLCAQLLFEVGYLGQEPTDIAWLHNLPPEQVEAMLLSSLRRARLWREDKIMQLAKEPGTIAPIPERRPYRPAA